MPVRLASLAATGLALVGLAAASACSAKSNGSSSSPGGSGPANANACTASKLQTHTPGELTVATDSPAYSPWFVDDKPANGKGYESAVAFAIAKQLGYPTSKVKWTVAAFNSVIAPTPKQFDFDVNQVSISATRAKVVDFSSGYYDVKQAVVTLDKNKYSKATSVAALKGAKLGAQKGTTSLNVINDTIKPGPSASEFPTNDLAVQALKNGQIDGLVVDFPTGYYITSVELKGAKIVGQLADAGKPEQFGAVLEHGSPLTKCISKAVDTLRSDGTLAALEKKWLTSAAGAPDLK